MCVYPQSEVTDQGAKFRLQLLLLLRHVLASPENADPIMRSNNVAVLFVQLENT